MIHHRLHIIFADAAVHIIVWYQLHFCPLISVSQLLESQSQLIEAQSQLNTNNALLIDSHLHVKELLAGKKETDKELTG